MPTITIVTPNYNLGDYLEETIDSVLSQGYPRLEYIIIDGGSTDNSVEIIKRHERHLAFWVSEPDNGLYHAVDKGFKRSSGEVMGWLNSDDMLHRKSLFSLGELFSRPELNWIQGMQTWFDKSGRIVDSRFPRLHSKYSYLMGDYHRGYSPFIQQESTYWRRSLWTKAGGYMSQQFKLAGDFELWMRFFKCGAEFAVTRASIGGFRIRGNEQLSGKHYDLYLSECDRIISQYAPDDRERRRVARLKQLRRFKALNGFPVMGALYRRYERKLLGKVNVVGV